MPEPKRITVEVPDDLHHRARVKSVQEGRTLSEVVRELVAAWLGSGEQPAPPRRRKGERNE